VNPTNRRVGAKWGVLAAFVALVVVAANGSSWRFPEFTMPEFSMPEFNLPEGAAPSESPPASVAISESPMFDPLNEPTTAADGSSTVQAMPFESCVRAIESMSQSFGQEITLVENTADRQVARFKFIDSRLTVTCSRSEGTMPVQR
jgi:hypothetical protein